MKQLFAVSALLLAFSCTNFYFEKPVPQTGDALTSAPANLEGVYEVLDERSGQPIDPDELFPWVKLCYIFEKLEGERLMVSTDARFHERDFERTKAVFAQKKAEGFITDYAIGQRMIFYTLAPNDTGKIEQAYIPMLKSGQWYVLTGSHVPDRLFDFQQRKCLEADNARIRSMEQMLPGGDSLSTKSLALEARQKAGAFYLNTREEGKPGWSLIYGVPAGNGDWLLKLSNMTSISDSSFNTNRAYYESITPFRKLDGNDYLVNPDDRALGKLLADTNLFASIRLRKLEE